MKLSVIIPAYNEEKNLRVLHERMAAVLEKCAPAVSEFELIFVNDGSRDGTLEGLRHLAQIDSRVKFLSFSRNFGHEIAVAAGLDRADGDAAVLIDADLQDPPELIEQMVERWKAGVQVVYAQRRKRSGDPVLKKIAIFFFYRILGRISEVDIPLDTGNFRLMDRRVVEVVRACRENPRFVRGLVPWAGFKQEPLLFDRDARDAGTTGYGFFKLAKLALDGTCSFSQAPLRVASYIGAAVIALSILATLWVITDHFLRPGVPQGFAFLACAVFFMGGIQLFMLGALAHYVGYIFSNVQNRPMYVIADEGGFATKGPVVGPSTFAARQNGHIPEIVVRPSALGAGARPVDDALYRLHAEREETYWWWVGKNRIIMAMIDRFWTPAAPSSSHPTSDIRHPTSPTALDIGCGAGGVLAKLAQRFDAVGVDMSPIARDYCAKRGLKAVDGSLPDGLPFKTPESFDVIVMTEVIEHVKEDRASVAAAAKLLRPGGLLVCTVPAHMWLWSAHDDFNFHQRRYTRTGFGSLFKDTQPQLEQLVLSYYQAASLPLVVGGRWVEKMRTRMSGRPPVEPIVKPLPGPINWTLTKAFEMEKVWLRRGGGWRSPWGTSVIGVYRRKGCEGSDGVTK